MIPTKRKAGTHNMASMIEKGNLLKVCPKLYSPFTKLLFMMFTHITNTMIISMNRENRNR